MISLYIYLIIGEIDYSSLSILALKTYSDISIVAPRNAMEAQIEAVWREQLGLYMDVCMCIYVDVYLKYIFMSMHIYSA
jgi:hypothetical protein